MRKFIAGATVAGTIAAAVVALGAPAAQADPGSSVGPITFEPPDYSTGNINGQQGWSKTGPYDVEVADPNGFPNATGFGFGTQALRMSNSYTDGAFSGQAYAPGVAPAGESTTGANHFDASFSIGSTQPAAQPDMYMSVGPDSGEGSRMSYLRFEDHTDGIHVFFEDVHQNGPCSPSGCANFTDTDIATLNYDHAHTVRFSVDFVPGPGNDIVNIYLDGALAKTGTTWEDYYRYDPEQAGNGNIVPATTTLQFHEGSSDVTTRPANAGNGYLVDNVSLASSNNGAGDKPTVTALDATPSVGNSGTSVTLQSSANDSVGLTDIYYNLFNAASGAFVCNLAHVSIPGAPASHSDTTVVSEPMPFAGLDTGIGGPCDADGIAEGTYVLAANWKNVYGTQVGDPNNQDLGNYQATAKFSPFIYDNTKPTLAPTVTPNPVALNGTATAHANASDNLSGVDPDTESCETPDTSTPGQHTVNCTATDRAGNIGTGSATYTVAKALNKTSTTCNGYYGGTGTDVVVPSGATCILIDGAHVIHDVNVQKGGTLLVQGATVDHNIKAGGAAGIAIEPGSTVGNDVTIDGTTGMADGGNRVCDSTIGHNLSVTNSTAGAGDWEIGCDAGNSIANDLNVNGNHNAVDVTNNTVGGNMTVTNNADATVTGNQVTHDANCSKNAVQSGSANTAGHKNTCPTA